MITFGVMILVLFGLYYFSDWFSRTTGYVLGEDQKAELATCLTTKGATFYISSTCPDCNEQLDMFGDAAKKLTVTTCQRIDECPTGGVPAWIINGRTIYGLKSFEELIKLSGCEVK
jgi:ribosomal protein S27E